MIYYLSIIKRLADFGLWVSYVTILMPVAYAHSQMSAIAIPRSSHRDPAG